MRTIFIVLQCAYDYDDSTSWPIFATPNELIALELKAEMERRLVARNDAWNSIQAHMAEYEKSHPRPYYGRWVDKPLPDFGPKKSKWSDEQKAEYAAAKLANQQGRIEDARPYAVWAAERYAEQSRLTATFPSKVQEDLQNLSNKNTWEIEQVPYSEESWQLE